MTCGRASGAYAPPVPFRFDAELWQWAGDGAWHFVTVPAGVSDEIEGRTSSALVARRGFGSVRVRVTIGSSTWTTSVFPDKQREAYVLPVKKDVRAREGVVAGDVVGVQLDLLEG